MANERNGCGICERNRYNAERGLYPIAICHEHDIPAAQPSAGRAAFLPCTCSRPCYEGLYTPGCPAHERLAKLEAMADNEAARGRIRVMAERFSRPTPHDTDTVEAMAQGQEPVAWIHHCDQEHDCDLGPYGVIHAKVKELWLSMGPSGAKWVEHYTIPLYAGTGS